MAEFPRVVFTEAVEYLRERLALDPDIWDALVREADAAARSRALDMSRAMNRDILKAVLQAMEDGTTYATFRKEFIQIALRNGWTGDDTAGWRSTMIFRTMIAQAQAAGRWREIQSSKRINPYLRYVTVGDHRVRPAHAAWHGVILPVDHDWWKTHYPPNGFQCRCTVMGMNERALKRYNEKLSDEAPPLNPVIKFVKIDGVDTAVEVPAGIDPGFAHNIGERGLALQTLANR